jgi:hypothetical protein
MNGTRSLALLWVGVMAVACGGEQDLDPTWLGHHEQPSICGSTTDWQEVEQYDGTLGVSRGFVSLHQRRVGRHTRGTEALCTGTLISSDLFLSAGHCGYAVGDHVEFNYQVDPTGSMRPRDTYTVSEVVESEWTASYDYAIVRLAGVPGNKYGWARLMARAPAAGDRYTIIQHPRGWSKKVATGPFVASPSPGRANWFTYGVDTLPGSSGSGVIDQNGFLIAVHTNPGCTATGGGNQGIRVDRLLAHSTALENVMKGDVPLSGDVDGDGEDDLVIWRPRNGNWYAKRRDGTVIFRLLPLGQAGDIPLVGDVDGDGEDDLVVWRPTTGRWYAKRSDNTVIFSNIQWGATVDIPLLADVDGDGDKDLVAWRPTNGNWFAKRRDRVVVFRNVHYGAPGDVPLSGDLNRDGIADLIIWRPSRGAWYASRTDGSFIVNFFIGKTTTLPSVGDVNGDGAANFVNWDAITGQWKARRLNGASLSPTVTWGVSTDIPLLGDFDGDSEVDFGYWHPSTAGWFAKRRDGTEIFSDVRWGWAYTP